MSWVDAQWAPRDYGVDRGGLSGQYGEMPVELGLKKLERTPLYENEDMMDQYFRSALRDRTCDAPAFESDMPRDKSSQDHLRSHVINMRLAAARTPAEPIHPDLFLGFTDRDPRGFVTDPDFRKYATQSWARGRFKDFLNDDLSDQTIPEGNRSNLQIALDIRKTQAAATPRLKIFSTSLDSRAVAAPIREQNPASRVAQTTLDGTLLDLNNTVGNYNRTDNTVLKGRMHRLGWRTTGDHRIPVAHYSVNSNRVLKAEVKAAAATTDHAFESNPAQVRNRIAMFVQDECARRKYFNDYKGDMQFNFSESSAARNVIGRLAADVSGARWEIGQTADFAPDDRMNTTRRVVSVYDPTVRDTVLVDQGIFASINEHKNITFRKRTSDDRPSLSREAIAEDGIETADSVRVANYHGVVKRGLDAPETLHEQEFNDPDDAPHRAQNHAKPRALAEDLYVTQHGQPMPEGMTFNYTKSGASQHWRARDFMVDGRGSNNDDGRGDSLADAEIGRHMRGYKPVRDARRAS